MQLVSFLIQGDRVIDYLVFHDTYTLAYTRLTRFEFLTIELVLA